ncbi:MAG: type IVB secretion system protein DotG/IcmE [Legionellaceae bacterium]|nr:type IVB secretion system protein DotG/IcmE [Legionellaceae bacterium]
MAGKKENIKALFSNTRSRIIIVFTVIMILATVVIGFVKFNKSMGPLGGSSGAATSPGGIKSIPGALDQTAQYSALQSQQNTEQAEQAVAKGTSSIPTIIRSQAFGEGVESVGATGGQGSVGFVTLARDNITGPQSTLWFQNLKDTFCSKESIDKAVNQNNASMSDLRLACTCEQLKNAGYNLVDLKSICECSELRIIGFGIRQFKAAGFPADELRACGFVACEEHAAGFTAIEMKNAGYSDGELKGAGFTDRDIALAGGLPDGVSIQDVQNAGCTVENLKRLRASGVTAAAIRRISGCTAAQLMAAGFNASELKNAGFSAAELKDAGFTAEQLKAAGYNARDLLNAGFTPDQLSATGFSEADISAAEAMLPIGFTSKDVSAAGCSPEALKRERLAGVSAAMIKKNAHCTAEQLRQGGFTTNDLQRAGFSPTELAGVDGLSDSEIRAAGCDVEKIKVLAAKGVSAKRIHDMNGCGADVLKQAGFDSDSLLDAGFSPKELIAAGFATEAFDDEALRKVGCDPAKLKALFAQGVSAKRIHAVNGCSAAALKQAGFDAASLMKAGFTPSELLAAGFTPNDLAKASASLASQSLEDGEIRAAGCDVEKIKVLAAKGISAKRIHDLNGCGADVLKKAGFDAKSLLDAGFTPQQLLAAGFAQESFDDNALRKVGCDPAKLKALFAQGVSAKRIHDMNGCSADALKKAGFDIKALAEAGFTPTELLAAGFTPDELKKAGLALTPAGIVAAGRTAGCTEASLKAARAMGVSAATIKQTLGCSADALKQAGFSAAELKEAGYTAAELKNAGFSANDLKLAGYSAKDLRAAGFSASELKAAGFDAKSLHDAGFSAESLKEAGFTAEQLKTAGYSASDLKNAGLTADELHKAGYSANDLKDAGFSVVQLKNAKYTADEIAAAGVTSQDSALAGLESVSPLQPEQSNLTTIPSITGNTVSAKDQANLQAENAKHLQEIMKRQQAQQVDQRFQQKIQQRTAQMLSVANQMIQPWKTSPTQQYLASSVKEEAGKDGAAVGPNGLPMSDAATQPVAAGTPLVRMGDVLFAVIDTSVNTDEPGPILATIVTGTLKGGKLIGTFNLPGNADKMVISFNSLSMPGAPKTLSISAFAIDPNTARTALSSQTDHHYLMRYGSLFASTFLEGFGNAFQSANTTISVGGTGGQTNTTVQNGIGRSTLENAVIGLATVGKAWGQVAQQNMSRPTTVQVYSGTAVGVLFTQDLTT